MPGGLVASFTVTFIHGRGVRESMNLRKLFDPRYGLLVLIPATLSLTIALWVLQDTYARDLSLFLSLSVAAFTALVGAGGAMWIYRHLTLESQDRRFRHELEVRHFEDIYGPLYEEVGNVVEHLKEYQVPRTEQWDQMRRGRFGPFVESAITRGLNILRDDLEALGRLARESSWATQRLVTQAIGDHPITKKLSADDSRRLMMTLHQDYRLFFNPEVSLPREDVVRSVQKFLGETASPIPEEEIPQFFQHVKTVVTRDPIVNRRMALTREILPFAEAVHERLLQRMRYPFR